MFHTSITFLLFCFHSRWNNFYSRFFGFIFFPQILSLQPFVRKAPNLWFWVLSFPCTNHLLWILADMHLNPQNPSKSSCALLSPYDFSHFQAWAVTSSGHSFSAKEEEKWHCKMWSWSTNVLVKLRGTQSILKLVLLLLLLAYSIS